MSDRMKRRKKGSPASKEQAANAPEPLQPKYFEAEMGEKQAEPASEAAPSTPEPAPVQHVAPQHSASQHSVSQPAAPSHSMPSRAPSSRPPSQRSAESKETQADFQLGTRRIPELPLAEAVQNEVAGRPARRRRKRGGRGGERRSPGAPANAGSRTRPDRRPRGVAAGGAAPASFGR